MKLKLKGKNLIFLLLTIILMLSNSSFVFGTSKEPNLVSEAAILMDKKTGKVLYAKEENKKMYPASTTKILTAILALENSHLDDLITVSYDAVMSIPDGYSSASLQVGEQLTVEQLLELVLIHSANDAANVLAEYVGGSVESFVSMMNTKVHELGLSNTHFTNAYGMHHDNHYTTCQDLANIMKYCIQNEDFRRIAGSASCVLPSTNKYGTRKYASTNELIIPNHSNYYPYLTCGKTGFTSQAGDCLVSCAYKNDLELICVVLGGKTRNGISTRFSETKDLYEYGYGNYTVKTIVNVNDVVTQLEISNGTQQTKNLDLLANNSIVALLKNSILEDTILTNIDLKDNIQAPIEQGDYLGHAFFIIDDTSYETDLIAAHSVEESKLLGLILEIGIGCLFIIFACILFFINKKKKIKYLDNTF